jgi:hypothetical protein
VCLDDFEQRGDVRVQSSRDEHEGGQRWHHVPVLDGGNERAGQRPAGLSLAQPNGKAPALHFGPDQERQ